MSAQTNITAVKDCVGIVREVAIIVAVAVLVVDPGLIAQWAKSANDKGKELGAKNPEVNVGPAKFAFDNSVEQAAQLDALRKENEALKKNAELLVKNAGTTQGVQRAKEVVQSADSLNARLQSGISAAKTQALAQDQLVQEASATPVAREPTES